VGVDRNRDRDLADDNPPGIGTDRQAQALLKQKGKNGTLVIATQVSDIAVSLPIPALPSSRVNVIARIDAAGQSVWSNPQEVVVDGKPPRIIGLELLPGPQVVAGEKMKVIATATDDGLSGVRTVQALVDTEQSGQFPPASAADKPGAPKPVQATLGDDGNWTATLPSDKLSQGRQTILVRAIDQAGNTGDVSKVSVEIITKKQAADALMKRTNRVFGTVTYGGKPAAGVTVTLEQTKSAAPGGPSGGSGASAPAPQPTAKVAIPPMTTGDDGRFDFPKVPPGQYHLTARGVVRNVPRKELNEKGKPGPLSVKVPPGPRPNVEVDVQVK